MSDNKPHPTDWLAIEGEYRLGARSIREMAPDYGITEGAIRARAKKYGWTRDPTGTKRQIVAATLAGATRDNARDPMRGIESEAQADVEDMQRGIRISRMCLLSLEQAADHDGPTPPKDIKIIIEATGQAIDTIRRIRGLDDPAAKDNGTDDDDDARAAAITERLAKRTTKATT